MRELLFDGKHKVDLDDVLEKMNYFIASARTGMEIHENDPAASVEIAKELRRELEKEYKNNSLNRIETLYRSNEFFNNYRKAVHESIASIVGRTTKNNVFSFLYDVDDYMRFYLPESNI